MNFRPIKLILRGMIIGLVLCGMPLGFKAMMANTPHQLVDTPDRLTVWQAIILIPGVIGCIIAFLALVLGIALTIGKIWFWIWKNEQQ